MKYCENCGKSVEDNSGICKQCGSVVSRLNDDNNQMNGGTFSSYNNENENCNYNKKDDSLSFWYRLLSFLMPIVGFVLYFVWKKEYPIKAKSALNSAIAGFVTALAIEILSIILLQNSLLHLFENFLQIKI